MDVRRCGQPKWSSTAWMSIASGLKGSQRGRRLAREAGVLQSDRRSSAFASQECEVVASRCKVPLFDLTCQSDRLGPRLTERMAKVLEHGHFILGPEVAEFELALARYVGAH